MKKGEVGGHQQQLSFGMLQLPMQQMMAQNSSNVKFFCRVKQAGRRAPSTLPKEAKRGSRVLNSARSKPARS